MLNKLIDLLIGIKPQNEGQWYFFIICLFVLLGWVAKVKFIKKEKGNNEPDRIKNFEKCNNKEVLELLSKDDKRIERLETSNDYTTKSIKELWSMFDTINSVQSNFAKDISSEVGEIKGMVLILKENLR